MPAPRKPGPAPIPITPIQREALERLIAPLGRPGDPDGPAPARTLEQIAAELNKEGVPPRTRATGTAWATDTAEQYERVKDQIPNSVSVDLVRSMLRDADAHDRLRQHPESIGAEIPDLGAVWTGSGVRSAIRALRRQRLDLLTRVGDLLEVLNTVQQVRPLRAADLTIASQHGRVDPWWLWDRFQHPEVVAELALVDSERHLAPPVAVDRSGALTITPGGLRILEIHRGIVIAQTVSQGGSPADVLAQMLFASKPVGEATLRAICSFFGTEWVAIFDFGRIRGLVRADPPVDDGPMTKDISLVLTDLGREIAQNYYDACVVQGEGDLLRAYHPVATELERLPHQWDWSDRPLLSGT